MNELGDEDSGVSFVNIGENDDFSPDGILLDDGEIFIDEFLVNNFFMNDGEFCMGEGDDKFCMGEGAGAGAKLVGE